MNATDTPPPKQTTDLGESWNADCGAMLLLSGRESWLDGWRPEACRRTLTLWSDWRRLDQETPPGDWTTWLLLGGRGAGKTRAGAEWIAEVVRGGARRIALVGETYEDAREVMIEGPSGLAHIGPEAERPRYVFSRHSLVWPNGAEAHVFSAADPEGLRGYQYEAAWSDEIGCSAADKGANQPNVFVDPKSSESFFPYHSDRNRDDLIQRRFIEAHLSYWTKAENNPLSPVYGGSMVEPSRVFLYTWDARPFPDFPVRSDVWSDAENWTYGHWLNGRAGKVPLGALIEEVARASGLHAVDASACAALVTGYVIDRPMPGRDALQPLFDLYQLDATERDGVLIVRPRGRDAEEALDPRELVDTGETILIANRGAPAERATSLSLTYTDGLSDYRTGHADAALPDARSGQAGALVTAVVLEQGEAEGRLACLLAEAASSDQGARFSLPPGDLRFEPADVVALEGRTLRLTAVADGDYREVEAVATDPSLYRARYTGLSGTASPLPRAKGPVVAEVLDIPLLPGEPDGLFLHVAAFAEPWPGAVAIHAGPGAEAPRAAMVAAPALVGRLAADLPPGPTSRWDRASVLRVRLSAGALSSLDRQAVLSGGGYAAVRVGQGWELLQYQDAVLGEDGTWRLTRLLRGQRGTEDEAAQGALSGTRIVFLSGAETLALPADALGTPAAWQAGPAGAQPGRFPFAEVPVSVAGVSARPFAPAHLRAAARDARTLLSWVRRSRIGGDAWGEDTPLGEAEERYRVTVWDEAGERSRTEVGAPEALVDAAGATEVWVQQLSALVGPGRPARLRL